MTVPMTPSMVEVLSSIDIISEGLLADSAILLFAVIAVWLLPA
jgi:hypothetical protein